MKSILAAVIVGIFSIIISENTMAEPLQSDKQIGYVEQTSSWVYLYDAQGKRYKTLAASSTGEILGYSATFFVSKKGSWIYLFDAQGRRYKTLAESSVGDVIGVSANGFTSRKGSWVYTFDREGKRINSRAAN